MILSLVLENVVGIEQNKSPGSEPDQSRCYFNNFRNKIEITGDVRPTTHTEPLA